MTTSFNEWANPGVLALSPYQPGKPIEEVAREFGLTHIVKLASNENPLGPSPKALTAIATHQTQCARYPDASGYALKQKLAEIWQIDPCQLTLGAGSEALFLLIAQTFVKPGETIMVSEYAFATFAIVAHLAQAQLCTVPALHWGNDLEAMLQAITPDTRLLFIANPNNPTGTWHDQKTLSAFLDALPKHVIVVLDEAYAEFMTHEPTYPNSRELLKKYPHVIITRTFSKLYGLAGLRLGYALSDPEAARILHRAKLPFNVSGIAMVAGMAALEDSEHQRATLENNNQGMRVFRETFDTWSLPYLPVTCNFITVQLPVNALAVYNTLLEKGMIVRPLLAYGLPDYLRISIGTMPENLKFLTLFWEILCHLSLLDIPPKNLM